MLKKSRTPDFFVRVHRPYTYLGRVLRQLIQKGLLELIAALTGQDANLRLPLAHRVHDIQ